MAIQNIGTTISGIASDTKPTLTANEKGVIFIETDTNKIFQWDTDSWNQVITSTDVAVGALDSGSITSNFGTIDTGSSAITTTGLISGGSLDIDDVLINGTTIGHTNDTDLITVADGIVTIAGEISTTTLDIGGTNVTSTAAEINLLDALDRGSILYGNASGATTVLGQGSADQVLTSDGTDIAWQDAGGGGGTMELVADGIIEKGTPVYVTSAGKAKQVTGAWDYMREVPNTSSAQWSHMAADYDPDYGVMLCRFKQDSTQYISSMLEILTSEQDSTRNTVLVNAERGNGVDQVGQYPALVYNPDQNAWAIFGTGTSNDGFAMCSTTSKNFASHGEGPNCINGSKQEFDTDNAQYKAAGFHANRNKVYLCWEGTSNAGEAQAFTMTGGTTRSISYVGSRTVFNSGSTGQIHTAYDPDNERHLVVYVDEGNSSYGTARVGLMDSSNDVAYNGSETVFNSAQTYMETTGNSCITYDTNADRFLIIYKTVPNYVTYGIVADISGEAVSFGTPVPITAANAYGGKFKGQYYYETDDSKGRSDYPGSFTPMACEFSPDNNKICVVVAEYASDSFTGSATDNSTNGSLWVTTATIDPNDNSVSFTEPDLLYPGWVTQYDGAMAYDTENNRMVFWFVDPIGKSLQMAFADGTLSTGFDNGYLEKFIGFAGTGTGTNSRYDDGDTVTISLTGHLNESQSSLTVGQAYWLKGNGYLSNNMVETNQAYRVWAGVATHATKLAVSTRIESHPEIGSLGGPGRS